MQIVSLKALTRLIPLYPTLHRAQLATLQKLTLAFLNGSHPTTYSTSVVSEASKLYAVLPLTAGKVGAAGAWRKSVDETVMAAKNALGYLRTTLEGEGKSISLSHVESL